MKPLVTTSCTCSAQGTVLTQFRPLTACPEKRLERSTVHLELCACAGKHSADLASARSDTARSQTQRTPSVVGHGNRHVRSVR